MSDNINGFDLFTPLIDADQIQGGLCIAAFFFYIREFHDLKCHAGISNGHRTAVKPDRVSLVRSMPARCCTALMTVSLGVHTLPLPCK